MRNTFPNVLRPSPNLKNSVLQTRASQLLRPLHLRHRRSPPQHRNRPQSPLSRVGMATPAVQWVEVLWPRHKSRLFFTALSAAEELVLQLPHGLPDCHPISSYEFTLSCWVTYASVAFIRTGCGYRGLLTPPQISTILSNPGLVQTFSPLRVVIPPTLSGAGGTTTDGLTETLSSLE